MKELRIANFKFGLDSRREQLTSQLGTLVTCENGHISPGGEVQKRLAFVENGDLSVLDSNADQGTFGLENLSGGLTVFGSALPSTSGYASGTAVVATTLTGSGSGCTLDITVVNGVITAVVKNAGGAGYTANDYITPVSATGTGALVKVATVSAGAVATVTLLRGQQQGQPVLVSAMPAGYSYQQLKHPAILDAYTIDGVYGDASVAVTTGRGYHGFDTISNLGQADLTTADAVNYDRTKHRITAVVFSNTYEGNSFIAVTFSDGNTFLYSNGSVVRQSCTGKMLSSYTTGRNKPISIAYNASLQLNALSRWAAQADPADTAITDVDPTEVFRNFYAPCRIGVPGASGNPISSIIASRTTSGNGTNAILQAFAKPSSTLAATASPTTTFTITKSSGTPVYRVSVPLPLAASPGVITNYYFRISAEITWATSDINTAGLIAAGINALTATTGYSAANGGTAIVTVTAPLPTTPLVGTLALPDLSVAVPVATGTDSTAPGLHAFSTGPYETGFQQLAKITVDDYGAFWQTDDIWSVSIVHATQGNITIGKGNIAGQTYVNALKLGTREFLGFGSTFAYSALGDPAGWEEQNIGAGTTSFVSEFGGQDSVLAFSHMQGRLAVFGRQSIQMWQVDADPNNFALVQTIDNIGTIAPFSVQSVGDSDSYFLDSSGIRSLKPKEVTLNAYPDDVGIAIDLTVRAALLGYDATLACSIIEPTTRQYWLYLNGNIYVLSNYPTSKVLAWNTFKSTYEIQTIFPPSNDHYSSLGAVTYNFLTSGLAYTWTKGANETNLVANGITYTATITFVYDGTSTVTAHGTANLLVTAALVEFSQTAFIPNKFVVYNKQVYVRGTNNKVYLYGGTDNNTYDRCVTTVELPFLSVGDGSTRLQALGIDATIKGNWDIYASLNPRGTMIKAIENKGSTTSPNSLIDSTYDTGHYGYSANGTHFKLKAVSGPWPNSAKLSSLTLLFAPNNIK